MTRRDAGTSKSTRNSSLLGRTPVHVTDRRRSAGNRSGERPGANQTGRIGRNCLSVPDDLSGDPEDGTRDPFSWGVTPSSLPPSLSSWLALRLLTSLFRSYSPRALLSCSGFL